MQKESAPGEDALVVNEVESFLTKILPTVKKHVVGDIDVFPTWMPRPDSVNIDVFKHLEKLKIPSLEERPNLLLHDLGSFAKDGLLKEIFVRNKHTFLVNATGSGKTRLLLEGLCQNWGFYFTSIVDSDLGSHDVENGINKYIPMSRKFRHELPPPVGSAIHMAILKTNRKIANRIFRRIFLARLIVFHLFLLILANIVQMKNGDIREKLCVYKKRWLLFQLRLSITCSRTQYTDIFADLSSKILKASDDFVNTETKSLLASARILCSEIDANLSSTLTAISTSDSSGQTLFFCVLDGAQHAATQRLFAFKSDYNGAHHLILREIMQAWEGQFLGENVFMVVAGTYIPEKEVPASASMTDSLYRRCYDTGSFDRNSQEQYLKKYLPKEFLVSAAGKRLMERVWYWLRGRYHFTTGYVSDLLSNGFRRPHGLLNAYIQHFANFNVTDAAGFIMEEGVNTLHDLPRYTFDVSMSGSLTTKEIPMLLDIHPFITRYLVRSFSSFSDALRKPLETHGMTCVQYGFGRFESKEGKVVVDEPLALLAATHWINAACQPIYTTIAREINLHESPSGTNGFENYVAFCIDKIFSDKRRIDEVFEFSGSIPAWAHLEAELIALHQTDLNPVGVEQGVVRHSEFFGPSTTLGTNAKLFEETSKWLEHGSSSSICFPHCVMGPDIIFVLRLADNSLIWVAIQAKFSSRRKSRSLDKELLKGAIRTITPSLFFRDKNGKEFSKVKHPDLVENTLQQLRKLQNRRNDAGKYSLLRVVASFPVKPKLERVVASLPVETDEKTDLVEDPDKEGHPIASLNMELVKRVTQDLSPKKFLQSFDVGGSNLTKRKRSEEPSTKGIERPAKKPKCNLN